jgi:hypothetical protein
MGDPEDEDEDEEEKKIPEEDEDEEDGDGEDDEEPWQVIRWTRIAVPGRATLKRWCRLPGGPLKNPRNGRDRFRSSL